MTLIQRIEAWKPFPQTLEDCVKLYNLDMGTGITLVMLQRDALRERLKDTALALNFAKCWCPPQVPSTVTHIMGEPGSTAIGIVQVSVPAPICARCAILARLKEDNLV